MKRVCAIIIFLYSVNIIIGQNIMLEKNVSLDAQWINLTQELSHSEDTLIIQCDHQKLISQVDVLNEDYFESIPVNENLIKVGLHHLPKGDYVVQVKIDNDWYVLSLKKLNHCSIPIQFPGDSHEKSLYWVVQESNSNFGSYKIMGLMFKHEVKRLITKTELKLRSKIARNNKLLVYQVYNCSDFMSKQLKDSKYYKSDDSNCFNVKPLYDSEYLLASW